MKKLDKPRRITYIHLTEANKRTNHITVAQITGTIRTSAEAEGYPENVIRAGISFFMRKNRHTNPPGHFDKFKRFYADEHTEATMNCRRPSAKWPYSQMTAARTAAHCAEVYDVEDDMLIFVKRVALACDRKYDAFTAREFLGKPFRKVLLAEARRMNDQARQLEDA